MACSVGGTGDDPLSFKLLGARLPHGEALAIRLEFVGFVVSQSPLELTLGHVETLWRDFLGNPLCGACVLCTTVVYIFVL